MKINCYRGLELIWWYKYRTVKSHCDYYESLRALESRTETAAHLESAGRQLAAAGGELQQARALLVAEVGERGPEPEQQALPVAARARHERVRAPVRHAQLARAAHQQLRTAPVMQCVKGTILPARRKSVTVTRKKVIFNRSLHKQGFSQLNVPFHRQNTGCTSKYILIYFNNICFYLLT